MSKWLVWAGIAFVVGGITSFAINLGVSEELAFREDLSAPSIAWITVGAVLIGVGAVLNYRKRKNS